MLIGSHVASIGTTTELKLRLTCITILKRSNPCNYATNSLPDTCETWYHIGMTDVQEIGNDCRR